MTKIIIKIYHSTEKFNENMYIMTENVSWKLSKKQHNMEDRFQFKIWLQEMLTV